MQGTAKPHNNKAAGRPPTHCHKKYPSVLPEGIDLKDMLFRKSEKQGKNKSQLQEIKIQVAKARMSPEMCHGGIPMKSSPTPCTTQLFASGAHIKDKQGNSYQFLIIESPLKKNFISYSKAKRK